MGINDALTGAAQWFRDRPKRWIEAARPDQLPPGGDWREWLVIGGRGSGKTRVGAETLKQWIEDDPGGEWAIIAPTYGDTWATCVEGPSGILAAFGTTRAEVKAGKHPLIKHYWRSWAYIEFHDGTIIRLGSADDGALRIQGKNLKGCWCDEIGLWLRWETAWDESVQFAVREGQARIIATGTPKVSRPAAKLIRRLIKMSSTPNDDGKILTRLTRLRTRDNLANLAPSFAASVIARAKGTRLERQELEGELLDDIEGALWNLKQLEADRRPELHRMGLRSAVVGVDPADGIEDGDEQAFTVMGVGWDDHLYVVESVGMHADVLVFLRAVVTAAVKWQASINVEKNHGGKFLIATLTQVMRELGVHVAVNEVSASQGKLTRAEPVAALYAQHRVSHVGDPMVELEDQLCSYTGNPKEKSPDRLDSLVWAAQKYLNYTITPGDAEEMVAEWATKIPIGDEAVAAWR